MHLRDRELMRVQCRVGDAWIDADADGVMAVLNPATGESLGSVPAPGSAEVRRAVGAADRAFPGWRARVAKDRAGLLRRWFELITAHQEDLAVLMTLEQGKPRVTIAAGSFCALPGGATRADAWHPRRRFGRQSPRETAG